MIPVTGEVPTPTGNVGAYRLAFTPAYGVAVYCNGLRQSPAAYSLSGAMLGSRFWVATDALLCDYQHA
jgi:hypothetical protein